MAERLPLFKLTVDDMTEGMDFMGLVDYPAHGKAWRAFAKNSLTQVEIKRHFNEEKRIVTGVAIATNQQIYRRDEDGFEYNVIFTPEDTLTIAQKLFENGYMHNVNKMHDMNQEIQDMYLFESFFVNQDRSNIPDAFSNQNLQPGSWIVSYKVKNDQVWQEIKEGKYVGFSIEGWFKEVEINLKKTRQESLKKTRQMKKSLLERLGFAAARTAEEKFDREKFESATTVDGLEIFWEGELAEGTVIQVMDAESGELILAAEGEYSWEAADGMMVIRVNATGEVESIEAVEEVPEDEMSSEEIEEAMRKLKEDYENKVEELKSKHAEDLKEVATEVDELREKFEAHLEGLETAGKKTKKAATGRPGWKNRK